MGQAWNDFKFGCAYHLGDLGIGHFATVLAIAAAVGGCAKIRPDKHAMNALTALWPESEIVQSMPAEPAEPALPNDHYANELRSAYNSAMTSLEGRKAEIIRATGAQSSEGGMLASVLGMGIDARRAHVNERNSRSRRSSRRKFDHKNWDRAANHAVEGADIYFSVPEIEADVAALSREYDRILADGEVTRAEASRFRPKLDLAVARSGYGKRRRSTRGIF
ncbi:hypothetical protein HN592_01745 [Candidatus Woesearchaeota archaeon]|jgi:hypothetical protein|nr:hypothetical protein [Candidatus Woesearchaeota archaeon]MBT4368595.1 hypothetical protein [Candidatus Woesearchaeota archaeon]MBT4713096.1 hypothetical protein [Candidatus Woesearchaeota archaeon]MBT6639018.1 hypothetical protein [Candidatus Woesearchaeota archaeon]MBT7134217.1 hypothetical protein [Candidatus Woesearchaeota archaeon]